MPIPHEPSRRPTIVLATTPGRFGSLNGSLRLATTSGLIAIDLDVRSAWRMPSVDQLRIAHRSEPVRIRSLWLPSTLTGMFARVRTDDLSELMRVARDDFGLQTLILPRDRVGNSESALHLRTARDLAQRRTGRKVRLALGLQASDFRHDRWHLDQLLGLRRMAEEWDLDLALDLSGNVAPTWEAEAAVLRVLPALSVVRLGQWRRADGGMIASQEAQVAHRTIAILADQGFAGTIAIGAQAKSESGIAWQQQDILRRYTQETPSPTPVREDIPTRDNNV
jgi:hypothetical protein